jgi:DNA-directed RNA polymerase subunit H (RpoH/RPB5)
MTGRYKIYIIFIESKRITMEIDIIMQNLKDMLVERGDDISMFEEHEADIDRKDFFNDKNVLEFQTSHTTLIFALTKKLRKNIIDELKSGETSIDSFTQKYNNKKNVIMIFNNDTISMPILSQLNRYDKLFQKNGGVLQFFMMKQLMFNPTKHMFVPKHVKLSETESADVMQKYMIKSKLQMPVILHNDIIAKWLGLRQGDIVKIERYNENSGISYYYRCCI